MEEETILESIFFDREQRVLANVSDEERNVILEIERDGNEDRLRNKIEEMLDYALEDVSKRYCASLEKYYKQGFKDGVNLIVECVS